MNYYTFRAREDLNIDTRTATEYGVVRTFFDGVFTWTTGNYTRTGSGTGATAYSGTLALPTRRDHHGLFGSGTGKVNGTDGNTSAGSLGVYYAFIQFAGFTMGKAVSQFDAPWTNYPGNITDNLVGGSGTVTGVNQFTYTADFGQGITASFSAEDPSGLLSGRQPQHDRRDRGRHDRRLLRHQRHRRHSFAEPRRYGPCRPGLGSVPGVGGCA